MNGIFFAIVLIAFATAGYRQIVWVQPSVDAVAPMQALALGMVDTAGSAVTLAIGLVGVMALFLGLMKVVPPDHPAMGAMILNMSANALGLGNAATPFGIRAMQELDKLNPHKGTATNAMALFLAINTSSVTLLPTGVIALRASAGSLDPAGILPTTLFATVCSTTVAIVAVKLYQRYSAIPEAIASDDAHGGEDLLETDAVATDDAPVESSGAYPGWVSATALLAIAALVPLTIIYGRDISPWIIPGLMVALLSFGVARGVRIYEVFVDGARDGFQVAVRIIPYLVAILVAVGMFRASGALDVLVGAISPVTTLVGMPGEALPMALLRPLSGSGAYGILASIINDPAVGPDSYAGYLVSTLQGSTETTFYVLAVYFGTVQIRRVRHALWAALTADLAGIIGAVAICSYLYG